MKKSILGRAIGACLAEGTGLRAAYLPDGVPVEIAEEIVRHANMLRSSGSIPFAILIDDSFAGSGIDDGCVRVWPPENAIKYRQGDRLVVALGRHPDIHSVATAFAEVLGLSYPESASSAAGLDSIVKYGLELVLTESGINLSTPFDRETARRRLEACVVQLVDVYREMRRGDLAWNAQWFRHIAEGFETLVRILSSKVIDDPRLLLDDALETYTFAAFSLPQPERKDFLLRKSGVGKAVVEAVDIWWSDAASITATASHLSHHPDTDADVHPIAGLNWSNFDVRVVEKGNALAAMSPKGDDCLPVVEAFARLTANQFLDPTNRLAEEETLQVEGLDGQDLSVAPGDGKSPYVVSSSSFGEGLLRSEPVKIRIPTFARPSQAEVETSQLTLRASPAGFSWQGTLEVDADGVLSSVGHFLRKAGGKKAKPIAAVTVAVDIPGGDQLSHLAVPALSSVVVYLTPPAGAGIAVFKIGSKGSLQRPSLLGLETLPELYAAEGKPQSDVFTMTFDEDNRDFQIIVWTADSKDVPIHDGKAMEAHKARPGFFSTRVTPATLNVIEVGAQRFELRAPEPRGSIQSPIVAAIDQRQVTGDLPDLLTVESIRGQLEILIADSVDSSAWIDSHGHLVLASNREDIPPRPFSNGGADPALLMHDKVAKVWNNICDEKVPRELLDSPESIAFRRAFEELRIEDALRREGSDADGRKDWVSRTSWRHLWIERREALEAYLDCYAALVAKAKDIGSPFGVFWASYPFSASVWDLGDSLQCTAVMLSPLHPLRLAWLASVEGTLWGAENAGSLAGTIEGWNFPLLGPKHTKSGRMIAIPTDSGDGQVFLGWSMLVSASVDGARPLVAPYRIGRTAAPASASSGLNATAASSALRSYRRMHPHVSTLTVDLAASSQTTRLDEVDRAVLSQLDTWAAEKTGSFRGGARVLDSLRRDGSVPSAAVAKLAKKNPGMPLQWSRYEPGVESQTCNVRLLQDAGVRLEVGSGNGVNLGVLPKVPLRRFEAVVAPSSGANHAVSRPAVEVSDQAWSAFSRALRCIEAAESIPHISSRLNQAALVDERADWTVSGESLLSPAAMATLVQSNNSGAQMLWEWRPPFLEQTRDVPVLERRPFVSVARVPFGFKARLADLLAKVTGRAASDEDVSELLGKLGARGVGLSSLLAMGGTHAAGALGFYLLFALAELAESEDEVERLVLPIDACDSYLKALAGTTGHAEKTQRADILVITISRNAITMVPVEIKFYGLDSAAIPGHLPDANSAAMKEPLEQLASTTDLLRRVVENGQRLRDAGKDHDFALWTNALTTLVEAGIRLKPVSSRPTTHLSDRLRAVAEGAIPLRLGHPVVAYFKHNAKTAEGANFSTRSIPRDTRGGGGALGLFSANSGAAFESVRAKSGLLVSAWSDLLVWASEPSAEDAERKPEQRDESIGVASAAPSSTPATDQPLATPDSATEASSDSEPDRQPPFPRPGSQEGVRFPVGNLLGSVGGGEADFWPSNTALNQMNMGVVGDLGTGKTQLLKALILQLRRHAAATQTTPVSVLVFDYKRDFQDQEFANAVGATVLTPHSIPLNIFALPGDYSPLAAYQKAASFVDVLSKIYAGVGPVQKDKLVTVITDLFREAGGVAPTLAEVRARYLENSKPDSVSGVLNTFVLGEIFSSDRSVLRTFDDLMEDTVLVVALSELGNDQAAKNALVALFLNFYYDYMRRSKKWPFEGTDPQLRTLNSFLLVDEATNIMEYDFDVLMNVMLQGREFGFGTILASQYLSHFKTSQTNYGEPLLTWFIHKVPNVTDKQLSQLGIPGATQGAATRIATLGVHEAYYSSLGNSGVFVKGEPFYRLQDSLRAIQPSG